MNQAEMAAHADWLRAHADPSGVTNWGAFADAMFSIANAIETLMQECAALQVHIDYPILASTSHEVFAAAPPAKSAAMKLDDVLPPRPLRARRNEIRGAEMTPDELRVSHDYENEEYAEDSQYCECDLELIEEEYVSMRCFCCGKEICP